MLELWLDWVLSSVYKWELLMQRHADIMQYGGLNALGKIVSSHLNSKGTHALQSWREAKLKHELVKKWEGSTEV